MARFEDERFLRGGSRYVSDLITASGALRVPQVGFMGGVYGDLKEFVSDHRPHIPRVAAVRP